MQTKRLLKKLEEDEKEKQEYELYIRSDLNVNTDSGNGRI